MKVKICGMKEKQNIAAIAELNPDYMGFIFYPPSPRYVGNLPLDFAQNLPEIITTAVFVNEELEKVLHLLKKYNFGAVQLHGSESTEYCSELKKATRTTVIKAFAVEGDTDFGNFKAYEQACDFFLFDAKVPGYGGSGKTFDWKVFDKYPFDKPFFLSGGLSPGNLSEALLLKDKGLPLHALDLNSKIEVIPGVKDVVKARNCIQLIKQNSKINN